MTQPEAEKEWVLGGLASGTGSNFRAIDDAIRDGRLEHATIGVLITDVDDAGVIQIAAERGIQFYDVSRLSPSERTAEIRNILLEHNVDVPFMAGYMRKLGRAVLETFPHRVLNIHPAPILRPPEPVFWGKNMYGEAVHRAVIESGVRWSGPTVHLADPEYDTGPILAHWPVPVLESDNHHSLAERVLKAEHQIYWRAIQDLIYRLENPDTYYHPEDGPV